ncbi:MAG: hypothetical protein IPJ65_26870 [Archangiaceae bacterium]|nr:hypothetical protein [Archangiaceae bacterium]
MRFEPHEMLMLQTHYVNATTQKTPLQAKVLVNFNTVDAASVKNEVGTAFATNQNIRICPGDNDKYFETTCKISSAEPVTIIGANSHFHSRGTKFTISVMDPEASSSAAVLHLDGVARPADGVGPQHLPAGGRRLPLPLRVRGAGGQLRHPDDSCAAPFGGKVETQEHCNAFVYFTLKTRDVGCF